MTNPRKLAERLCNCGGDACDESLARTALIAQADLLERHYQEHQEEAVNHNRLRCNCDLCHAYDKLMEEE